MIQKLIRLDDEDNAKLVEMTKQGDSQSAVVRRAIRILYSTWVRTAARKSAQKEEVNANQE